MTAKKTAAKPPAARPKVTVTANGDGTYHASYPSRRYRFLFADGRTIDVVGEIRDDSDLRAAMLKACKAERIVGVADLE